MKNLMRRKRLLVGMQIIFLGFLLVLFDSVFLLRHFGIYLLITSIALGVATAVAWDLNERTKRISAKALFFSSVLCLLSFPLLLYFGVVLEIIKIVVGTDIHWGVIYIKGFLFALVKTLYFFLFLYLCSLILLSLAEKIMSRSVTLRQSLERKLI